VAASRDAARQLLAPRNGIRHAALGDDLEGLLCETPFDDLFSIVNLAMLPTSVVAPAVRLPSIPSSEARAR
jgi:hypothetical protein